MGFMGNVGFMGGGQGSLHLTKPVVFLFLMGDGDGFEDDFVVALDAWDFDAVGLGTVGQLLVVFAEGVAEAVDIDFRGSSDKGLSADKEAGQEINARGLDDARHQIGKTDLRGVAVGVVAQGGELMDCLWLGGREGCDF